MYFRTRFFIEFSRPETLKTAIFLRKNNDFHKIDVFEKTRFLRRFWPPKTSQNRSQIPPKSQKIAFENKNKSQHASPQFFSNPPTGRSSPQRTPPWKPSPRTLLKVIHLPKYLISTPPSIHPFIIHLFI